MPSFRMQPQAEIGSFRNPWTTRRYSLHIPLEWPVSSRLCYWRQRYLGCDTYAHFLQEIARLLPENAPLSTLRLVTSSRGAMNKSARLGLGLAAINVLSACWRAGDAAL